MSFHWQRVSIEMAFLIVLLLYLPRRLARGSVRRRCREMGVPTPAGRFEIPWIALLLLALSGAASVSGYALMGMRNATPEAVIWKTFAVFSVSLIGFGVLLIALLLMRRGRRGRSWEG